MDNEILQVADDIIRPVMESAIVLASHYCKKCDRDCVTPMDLNYAMKFCARNVMGKHLGTMYPEIYEDEDEEEYDVVDTEDETPFSRYSGDDELMNKVNECWDTWDQWEPQSPMEEFIKRALASQEL